MFVLEVNFNVSERGGEEKLYEMNEEENLRGTRPHLGEAEIMNHFPKCICITR